MSGLHNQETGFVSFSFSFCACFACGRDAVVRAHADRCSYHLFSQARVSTYLLVSSRRTCFAQAQRSFLFKTRVKWFPGPFLFIVFAQVHRFQNMRPFCRSLEVVYPSSFSITCGMLGPLRKLVQCTHFSGSISVHGTWTPRLQLVCSHAS